MALNLSRNTKVFVSSANGVPTAGGGILTAYVSTKGTGYAVGDIVTLGTTSGSGATATVVVGGASSITSITITTPGKGYANGDTVTFAAGTLGGGSAAVTLTLVTADIGTVAFSTTYALVAGDLDADGGFSNNLYNFTFEANDTLTFQITVAPKATAANAGQTSINYAAKITMI